MQLRRHTRCTSAKLGCTNLIGPIVMSPDTDLIIMYQPEVTLNTVSSFINVIIKFTVSALIHNNVVLFVPHSEVAVIKILNKGKREQWYRIGTQGQ